MTPRMIIGAAVASLAWPLCAANAQPRQDGAGRRPTPATAPAGGPFWPQFNGPRGDNRSPDRDLLKNWPQAGPRLIGTYSGCGAGFSSVSLADGMIFTAGNFGADEKVVAMDLSGAPKWTAPNGKAWTSPWGGSRSTPTYNQGTVYQLGAFGRLAAFDARSGKEAWAVDLPRDGLSQGGFAESVLIDGNNVLCMLGSREGFIVALDKKTGSRVWTCQAKRFDHVSYVTPVLVQYGGKRLLIHASYRYLLAVDPENGKVLWQLQHNDEPHCSVVASSPVWDNGRILMTFGYGAGTRAFQVSPSGTEAKQVWKHDASGSEHGGAILDKGFLYTASNYVYPGGTWSERIAREGKLYCLDSATGAEKWASPIGRCSVAWADGRLYCLDEFGKMSLIEASPEKCTIVGELTIPRKEKTYTLSHPVIIGGRLYIRHGDSLFVYDVKAK